MTSTRGPLHGDPGMQRERTALAWQRTSISGVLVGAGAVVASSHARSLLLVAVLGALVTVVAVAAAAVSLVARGWAPDGCVPSPWPRLVVTASVPVVLALIGLVLATL